jgi:hypothetical protein
MTGAIVQQETISRKFYWMAHRFGGAYLPFPHHVWIGRGLGGEGGELAPKHGQLLGDPRFTIRGFAHRQARTHPLISSSRAAPFVAFFTLRNLHGQLGP